ncbi:hypothetical protein P2318_30590 [Myxococcaceae bacterium GXIMD 01537]
MLRKLLGTVLVLGALAGCTEKVGECQSDGDCQKYGERARCEETTRQCFVQGPEPEVDGGQCQFQCTAAQVCTSKGCAERFLGLTLTAPANGAVLTASGLPATVTAQLTKNPDYASSTTFPATIDLTVAGAGGGSETPLAPVSLDAATGTYSVQWSPGPGEAAYVLKASYAAAGLSATANVSVDTVGPTFEVVLTGPNPQPDADGFKFAQPSATPAWRRDQTVTLKVQSTATDVDPATFKVNVLSVGAPPSLTNLPMTDCAGAGPAFCKQADVKLWELGLNAFSGTFTVEVTGSDKVGNAGIRTGASGIPVTRWKWSFDTGAAGSIEASPALGSKGVLYFGTTNTNGLVFALGQEGTKKWEKLLGAVRGSPAVGRDRGGGSELIYVAATADEGGTKATRLYALQSSAGAVTGTCPESPASLGTTAIDMALGVGTSNVDPGGDVETAVTIYNSSGTTARQVALRPDAQSGDRCINLSGSGGGASAIPPAAPGSSLVASGNTFFYATEDKRLTSYQLNTNAPRANWPLNSTVQARGLSLVGSLLYGSSANLSDKDLGGVFFTPTDPAAGTSAVTFLYPSATPSSRVFNLVIGKDSVAYFGAETGSTASLVRMGLAPATTPASVGSTTSLRAASVLGERGQLFTLNAEGTVAAWTASTFTQLWSLALNVSQVEASPTLDCLRDGTGAQVAGSPVGVLYVPAGSRMHAFIVDSPYLDLAAPWPKFQHDARNSGNPATPLTTCQP